MVAPDDGVDPIEVAGELPAVEPVVAGALVPAGAAVPQPAAAAPNATVSATATIRCRKRFPKPTAP
jgi:hypothetical protein